MPFSNWVIEKNFIKRLCINKGVGGFYNYKVVVQYHGSSDRLGSLIALLSLRSPGKGGVTRTQPHGKVCLVGFLALLNMTQTTQNRVSRKIQGYPGNKCAKLTPLDHSSLACTSDSLKAMGSTIVGGPVEPICTSQAVSAQSKMVRVKAERQDQMEDIQHIYVHLCLLQH